jgi:putative ABC transport system substrate-binding protein
VCSRHASPASWNLHSAPWPASIGALLVQTNPLYISHRRRIVELVARSRVPAVYGERRFVDAGGLMFYGAGLIGLYREAAIYADKILLGARPGDLPVEQPTKLELVINIRTARALGLPLPRAVLLRADQVIGL